MFNVRPRDALRVFTVISDDDGDCRVELPDAVNEVLKLFVTQKRFCGDGHESADIIF